MALSEIFFLLAIQFPYMKRSPVLPLILLLSCFAGLSPVEAWALTIWHRDYPTALAEAKAEKKSLLIVFTGTDWIDICARFYDDILGQPAFMDAVSDKFTLLKLEYPKDGRLPREEAAQKALLRDVYRVRGFPTVILCGTDGRPFGVNGYQPLPPKEYAEQIVSIADTYEDGQRSVEAAQALEGVEKAKAINRAIPDLSGVLIARFYQPEMEAVLAADEKDELKLAEPYGKLIAEVVYEREINAFMRSGEWVRAAERTDQYIKEYKLEGEAKQTALLRRAGLERRAGEVEKSVASLREVVAINAGSRAGKEATRLLSKEEFHRPMEAPRSSDAGGDTAEEKPTPSEPTNPVMAPASPQSPAPPRAQRVEE